MRRADIERKKSIDVERWLKDKFRTGCTKMKKDFESIDKERKGLVGLFHRSIVLNASSPHRPSQIYNYWEQLCYACKRLSKID